MQLTTMRVVPAGVFFYADHARRIASEGQEAVAAFERFARGALPGVWRVTLDGAALTAVRRGPSLLADGLPTRFAVSPFAGVPGPFPKPPPGGPYDPLRAPDAAVLLTSADGEEILEEARSAVVALRAGRFVAVPPDRPRVISVSEAALDRALGFERAPLPVAEPAPLALLNALVGAVAPNVPGRPLFPEQALDRLRRAALTTIRRP